MAFALIVEHSVWGHKKEIEDALGNLIIGIEHIGSTAVEGMSAKPWIDLDVIIKVYSVFAAVVDNLATISK